MHVCEGRSSVLSIGEPDGKRGPLLRLYDYMASFRTVYPGEENGLRKRQRSIAGGLAFWLPSYSALRFYTSEEGVAIS
jgi:hypothetical protein